VEVEFTKSARKHKISKKRVREVIANHQPTVYLELGKTKLRWVGEDSRGLIPEIVAVLEEELIVVIHAMPDGFRKRG